MTTVCAGMSAPVWERAVQSWPITCTRPQFSRLQIGSITTELLQSQGVQVTQAWNGEEAAARFRESTPFSFDAILMDMQMPVMDGCEAARQIRALDRPDAGAVPIIAVTANAFSEDVSATTAAGMDAHVSKPIDFAVLRQTLERLLSPRTE